MRRSLPWALLVIIALPLVAWWVNDPQTQSRYALENAARTACRDAVRGEAEFPSRAEFKLGWRQMVQPEKERVVIEGRVGLMTASGDTRPHTFKCLFDGRLRNAQLLDLRPDERRGLNIVQ